MKDIENAILHLKVRNFTGKQMDMAIEALEKQIPEKPIQQNDKVNHWHECGKCRHIISKIMDQYCPHCGQKIKWE